MTTQTVSELEERIAELKHPIPLHPVPPVMLQELEELEKAREARKEG